MLTTNPFLDCDGQIRIGGRLQNANLSYEQTHPVIMPYNHHVTRLIINDAHEKTLHGGFKTVLIRQKYWIIKCKCATKTIINNCVSCAKVKAQTGEQLMGNLPAARVNPARCFTNCGVDYAGSFELKCSNCEEQGNTKDT